MSRRSPPSLDDAVDALPLSVTYPCGYFPNKLARQQAFHWDESQGLLPPSLYQGLMDRRFRRSGRVVYRPSCEHCALCVPIRLHVESFVPSTSQRRALEKNLDVEVSFSPPVLSEEKQELYRRYQAERHGKSSDDAPGEDELHRFLYDSPTTTIEGEYRVDGRLVGVSICDVTDEALSAVYFYYDPAEHKRSLGVFSALKELEQALQFGCEYYYLGYWIEGCRKMDYKAAFAAHELLIDGQWVGAPRRKL